MGNTLLGTRKVEPPLNSFELPLADTGRHDTVLGLSRIDAW